MAMTPRSTESAIGLAPAEAIDFLRQKTNTTSTHWTDLWNEAHSRGFMVAGAASQALVSDFRDAVAKALEQGTTLVEFRKDFDAIVAKHGWVHNGTAAWRAQIIYETNLSMAYSAGRYAQMTEPDTLRVYPYWQYQHTSSARPRPQHLAWVGTTLRYDDPWWSTHYPPNGWRCRCSVRPVSGAGLKRQGKDGPDKAPPVDMRPWRNPKTGQVVDVPHGIDPGFGYNPGAAWLGEPPPASGAPRPPTLPPSPPAPRTGLPPAEAVAPPSTEPSRDMVKFMRTPEGVADAGDLAEPLARAIMPAEIEPLVDDGAPQVRREVLLSAETAIKQLAQHPELDAQAYVVMLPKLLDAPDLVLREGATRLILMRVFDGRALAAFVKATRKGDELYLTSLRGFDRKDVARLLAKYPVLLGSMAALWGDDGAPKGPPRNPS